MRIPAWQRAEIWYTTSFSTNAGTITATGSGGARQCIWAMTLTNIGQAAEALGISESRVSQIHTRAVERLRGRVGRALAS